MSQLIQVSHISGRFFTSWATREAQEYWSGQPILSPADLPNPRTESGSPAFQADSLPTELSGKPITKRQGLSNWKKYRKILAVTEERIIRSIPFLFAISLYFSLQEFWKRSLDEEDRTGLEKAWLWAAEWLQQFLRASEHTKPPAHEVGCGATWSRASLEVCTAVRPPWRVLPLCFRLFFTLRVKVLSLSRVWLFATT